ncbi:DUF5017 domain-containing protein [Pedobacter arcticus]|uniref:DUF5017 domain-containing protein n=1 Tax=Pedobacter arcticus TaxID=752140 RepID=UPI00031FF19C|nr:DUF5017 domain-containing protein [Pedobacter arcticus]
MNKFLKLLIAVTIVLQACEKIESVKTPDFSAELAKQTYFVGDTVEILFKGDPNFITFYSGEIGNDYGFKESRQLDISYLMNFDTQVLDGWQKDQLSILVSSNFDEDYSIDGAHRATWTDVTSKFRMLLPQENRVYTTSGFGDITSAIFNNLQQDSAKVYFAVKQQVKNQTIPATIDPTKKNIGSLNRVRGVAIQSKSAVNQSLLFNHGSFEWKLFSTPNKEANRAELQPTVIQLRANAVVANLSQETEDWVISKKMVFAKSLDAGPDWGKSIKSLNDKRLDSYKLSYSQPGDYTITLIAFNSNVESRSEVLKQINIKIQAK